MLKKIAAVAFTLVFISATALPANNAEEVIFSTPGFFMNLSGNTRSPGGTPFGFWIWCAGSAAPGSNGGYQNANACQGNMYFYALDQHANGVIGEMSEVPEGSGLYHMHVVQGTAAQLFSGTLNPSFTCDLSNDTPDPKGPSNGVTVSCTFTKPLGGGTGHADVTNAVANVTGP
jgi:hypothetical protein